jgi:hypothetical protein
VAHYLKIEPGVENPRSPPGFVFMANIRALASSASVFWEVVYGFRELAPVGHASRTSTRLTVERIMRRNWRLEKGSFARQGNVADWPRSTVTLRQRGGASGFLSITHRRKVTNELVMSKGLALRGDTVLSIYGGLSCRRLVEEIY